ncbi:MAG: gephyrin-like molybdotransferase Glp [Ahrensia sp.]|nr:gephyrin-like molybdotransferase Glp [Ahrensia sp.]
MSQTPTTRQLLDDCFLHDKDRMKHAEVLETIARVVSLIVGDEMVGLEEAAGRICAADITAPRNVPLASNSAVDGYAFDHGEYVKTQGRLELAALIAAGDTHSVMLKAAQCARIFTGAIMPQNAQTVAMQEDCTIGDDGLIHIPAGLKLGANSRVAGEDLKSGDMVVREGDFLTPARIAALASIGCAQVLVRQKLRIGILSTGNEIIEPGAPLSVGKIYDANRPMLKALLASEHVEITDLGIAADDEAFITDVIRTAASDHDLILTSGGASRGDEDHMLNVLAKLGSRHLWQIAIKPGRPMMFGQIGNAVIIGLPGNPVASMVCTNLYVFPLIAKLIGANAKPPMGFYVPSGFDIARKKTDRREFLRGWLNMDENGKTIAMKFPRDGSGLITGLRLAEGLIEIPEDVDLVRSGDPVRFIPFSSFKLG